MWGIHRWPVNSPQGQLRAKMVPFDDIIMGNYDDGNGGGDAYKGGIDDTSDIHDNNISDRYDMYGGCDWGHIKHLVESTWFLVRTLLDRKHVILIRYIYNMIINNSQQRCVKWMPKSKSLSKILSILDTDAYSKMYWQRYNFRVHNRIRNILMSWSCILMQLANVINMSKRMFHTK